MLEVMLATKKKVSPTGQQAFTTPGTYNFTVPEGVSHISGLAVGSCFSNGGGGLCYKDVIPVTPGEVLTVFVASETGTTVALCSSYVKRQSGNLKYVLYAGGSISNSGGVGGAGQTTAATVDAEYPLFGGNGGVAQASSPASGGGAAGYAGNGGNGNSAGSAAAPVGGGASGGKAAAGGGVGILGQGASGTASNGAQTNILGVKGSMVVAPTQMGYGAGGGKGTTFGQQTANGAVRLIWGVNRSYPSTQVLDM